MLKYSSKINRIRTIALSLIFIGMLVMYGGIYFRNHIFVATIFLLIGFVAVIASVVIYFWIGMLSTKTIKVICPACNKPTKVLGKVDICMHCREPLTLDKSLEGKEFSEEYNRKK